MIWYVFDMNGFPEPLHLSLARAFIRAAGREGPAGTSHLYGAYADHEATPASYYLHTADERIFARMIRQFGGHRAAVAPKVRLKEIRREDDPRTPTPEADTLSC